MFHQRIEIYGVTTEKKTAQQERKCVFILDAFDKKIISMCLYVQVMYVIKLCIYYIYIRTY